jgi:hypothetical protein
MKKFIRMVLISGLLAALGGCSIEPNIYGNIGISSGYSNYHNGSGPHLQGDIHIGGRLF